MLSCAGEADQVDNPDGTRNSQHPLIHSYKRLGNIQPNFLQLCSAIFYKKFTFLTKEWKYTAIMVIWKIQIKNYFRKVELNVENDSHTNSI